METIIYFCYLVRGLTSLILIIALDSFVDAFDPYYDACKVPKRCGNQTISFPFYIQGHQDSFCGYPGFNLSCDPNGRSILYLSGQNYVVRQIFYQNHSILVTNAAFLDHDSGSAASCVSHVRNLTHSSRFLVAKDQRRVVLLYNCEASSLVAGVLKYRIGCDAENDTNSVLAFEENDSGHLAKAFGVCGAGVAVVAAVVDGNGGVVMREVVRRGFVLSWLASECSECESSGGRCGFLVRIYHFRCFCPDEPHALNCFPSRIKERNRILEAAIAATAASVIGALTIILIFFCIKKQDPSSEDILRSCGPIQVRRYCYNDIKKISNSFKEKLGQGGFGSVYKGKLHDGSVVAVKVLHKSKTNGEEFINEVATISRTSHVNIVSLLGFCFEGTKRAIIYEFMANGSLEKFVFEDNATENNLKLDWETYYQISLGIARGLEYLHNTRILHCDIKPHNILLDVDFEPKISDFGLAKICSRHESLSPMLSPRGTIGYIAPEIYNRNFCVNSYKSDVYSYGMMVLDIVGGRKNVNVQADYTSEKYFPQWVYKLLEMEEEFGLVKRVNDEEDRRKVKKMAIVSLWCIQADPANRPTMSKVIEMLEGSGDSLQVPPIPFLSSRSNSSPGPVEISSSF